MKPSILAIIIAVLLIPVIGLVIVTASDKKSTNDSTTNPSPTPTMVTKAADLVDPSDTLSAKKVILKTSKGDITINLFPDKAEKTVKNFVTLGKRDYFNGIIFHRVIKDFVIQAGDPTGTGSGGESIYGRTFPDEINDVKIVRGSLAMANSGANTNGSQFFIVTQAEQPSLDGGYTNFGQVADEASMSVVQAIAAVPVDADDKPTEEVKITGFTIVE